MTVQYKPRKLQCGTLVWRYKGTALYVPTVIILNRKEAPRVNFLETSQQEKLKLEKKAVSSGIEEAEDGDGPVKALANTTTTGKGKGGESRHLPAAFP